MDIESRKICVVGLGYVGLPLAVAFAKKFEVVGFDINTTKVAELKSGLDRTHEVSGMELKASSVQFTDDPTMIQTCDFIIVAVPTPVTEAKIPDLTPLLKSSETVGENLSAGSIVVYESTVYPGATEEDCVPLLEKHSGLKCGVDFKVGYSPERINPGDKEHTLTRIVKVVSGMDADSLEQISGVYRSIIDAGVFPATSIKVAEAAKVIENTQRDLNIALMNELALIFEKMNIRTQDVLEAAGTKWNFLKFTPGLVGGHCIGVDPYYLTHKAVSLGYQPAMILAGRRINDGVGKVIAEKTIRQLIQAGQSVLEARVLLLGFTFKENVPDVRNTKVIEIVRELQAWGCLVDVHDPVADVEDAKHEYQIEFIQVPPKKYYQAVVLAVSHTTFIEQGIPALLSYMKDEDRGVLIDVKSCYRPEDIPDNIFYWSL